MSTFPEPLKPITLALQGGGAHGAYTWGILDYLLEDGRLDFEAVSATSAGAMNAAALAYGKAKGGGDLARETLHDFWYAISQAGSVFSPVKRTPWEFAMAMNPWMPTWSLDQSPAFSWFKSLTMTLSPYQFNPLNFNLLRQVLEQQIDFDAIHACDCIELFITATDVQSGTAKVFRNRDVDIEVLVATAALPFLFQAAEIDERYYWDGGYMGNPSLWPLFYHARSRDLLLVHVNPIRRQDLPRESYTIENRLNEITFNASLLKELRAIDFVKRLIREDMLKEEYRDHYKDIYLHAIRADDVMCNLSIASKFDTSWSFLKHLRDLGRRQARNWVEHNFEHVNERPTVDIRKDYLTVAG